MDNIQFRVRTITCFISLQASDFSDQEVISHRISEAAAFLLGAQKTFQDAGYEVQTIRIATNPFGDWLLQESEEKLQMLDHALTENNIELCALGPALSIDEVPMCFAIIKASSKFSCSADLPQNDVDRAQVCARTIQRISTLQDGLGNFRFCVASSAKPYIPFFPVAKSEQGALPKFAIGLENGALASRLLAECGTIRRVPTVFKTGMAQAIDPVQSIGESIMKTTGVGFVGIDTSLNPSLDKGGSVAQAFENLDEVDIFGGPGTLAAAAAITQCLQSLPSSCGYSGLMLPLCEDQRLAELGLPISQMLSISQVCGVGVDTVPIPGDCSEKQLVSLLLDVAGLANRWGKSLSCRVFPVPGKKAGEWTTFDSPYMVNARILPLS